MSKLTLNKHLNDMTVDALKVYVKKLDIPKGPTRKADLISALERKLTHHLAEIVALCSQRERLFLREAAYNRGKVQPSRFYGKYGRECPSPYAYHSYYQRQTPSEVSVLPLFTYNDDVSTSICVLDEFIDGFKQILKKPDSYVCKTVDQVPTKLDGDQDDPDYSIVSHSGQSIVLDELAQMLALVQTGKLRITEKSKRPTEATVRLVSRSLIEPDFQLNDEACDSWETPPGAVRAHAWPVLLQQCGWCKAKGKHLELMRAGKALLRDLGAQHIKQGLLRFMSNDVFDELNRINNIKGQTGKGKRDLTKPSLRKAPIYEALTQWPANEWMTFTDAYKAILALDGNFSVCRRDPWHLYFGQAQYGSLGYEGTEDGLERQYLRALIMEPLATLGLVDIAYTSPHQLWPEFRGLWGVDSLSFCGRYDGLMYVRLNDLGAYCLDITDTYQPQKPDIQAHFKILPNLELTLLQHHDLPALHRVRLEQYALPKSDYVWALDRQLILERLEAGTPVKQVREFLTTYGENELPDTVEAFLNDLDRRSAAVKASSEAILIEIRDKETAALIAHDRSARKYCHLAGDSHVVVPKQHEKPFRKALKTMGYILPK